MLPAALRSAVLLRSLQQAAAPGASAAAAAAAAATAGSAVPSPPSSSSSPPPSASARRASSSSSSSSSGGGSVALPLQDRQPSSPCSSSSAWWANGCMPSCDGGLVLQQRQQQQQQQRGFATLLRPFDISSSSSSNSSSSSSSISSSSILSQITAGSSCGPTAAAAAAAAATPLPSTRRGIVLAPAADAPRPLPRYRRLRDANDPSKWRRMVVRIPPQVRAELDAAANALVLTGRTGSARLPLSQLDPTGLVAMQLHAAPPAGGAAAGAGSGSLLLLVSPSKRYFRGIATHVANAVHGVVQGYLVGVTVKGVGYRLEPADASPAIAAPPGAPVTARRLFWEAGGEKTNVAYPHKQPSRVVRLKVGFTNAAIYKLPDGVVAFFLKPTLLYLYGADKATVHGAAAALRAVRPPNAYTGNGVLLLGEEVKLRQRAGKK